MKSTCHFRYLQFLAGNEYHAGAQHLFDGYAIVLQQWWHANNESPESKDGEWRDLKVESQ
jgi:hypothetical protein